MLDYPRDPAIGPLRIAQVAPLYEPVPPRAYGGTELVVHLLTEELVRRGHEVTLFASGDSTTSARLVPGSTTALWSDGARLISAEEAAALESTHHARPYQQRDRFDLIHDHGAMPGLRAAVDTAVDNVLVTHHRRFEPEQAPLLARLRGRHNAVSRAAAATFPQAGQLEPVHHGIDVDSYPFRADDEGYLLFLGRLATIKGPGTAVRVARMTGRRLIVAGRIHPGDRADYERDVVPFLDGDRIRYVGEADARQKRDLLAGAAALLNPIQWEEPFGLVMIEALACGTPVVATRRASTPEIVEDGLTGVLAGHGDGSDEDVTALAEALSRLDYISREDCRAAAQRRFTVAAMVDRYERRYAELLGRDGASAETQVVDGDLVGDPRSS